MAFMLIYKGTVWPAKIWYGSVFNEENIITKVQISVLTTSVTLFLVTASTTESILLSK